MDHCRVLFVCLLSIFASVFTTDQRQDNTSCVGRCNQTGTIPGLPCQCNAPCVAFGDCCPDYEDVCAIPDPEYPISNSEIIALSEELYELEGPNNAYRYITVNKSNSNTGGISPLALLSVNPAAYELDTIRKIIALYDNFSPDSCMPEIFTPEEQEELDLFIDTVLATPIMQRTLDFLASKDLPHDREDFFQIWAGQYSGCSGVEGSSGLENAFMYELSSSGGSTSGFRNWIVFAKAEEAGDITRTQATDLIDDIGEKFTVVEYSFQYHGSNRPIQSMFVGISPELELALYTLCYYARPNLECQVSLNGHRLNIETYEITYNGLKYVASAYLNHNN